MLRWRRPVAPVGSAQRGVGPQEPCGRSSLPCGQCSRYDLRQCGPNRTTSRPGRSCVPAPHLFVRVGDGARGLLKCAPVWRRCRRACPGIRRGLRSLSFQGICRLLHQQPIHVRPWAHAASRSLSTSGLTGLSSGPWPAMFSHRSSVRPGQTERLERSRTTALQTLADCAGDVLVHLLPGLRRSPWRQPATMPSDADLNSALSPDICSARLLRHLLRGEANAVRSELPVVDFRRARTGFGWPHESGLARLLVDGAQQRDIMESRISGCLFFSPWFPSLPEPAL